MQDRYAGDVGDFGKFGMLRCIENTGLRVGVNWYLVGDESHNNDGKHIGYLEDDKYRGCDDAGGTALSVGTGCVHRRFGSIRDAING